MELSALRFYGRPFSEAESSWPAPVRRRMKRRSFAVVFKRLRLGQLLRFGGRFAKAKAEVQRIDLAPFRERGLTDQRFIDTQLEYLAFFIALRDLVGVEEAVDICRQVMEEASYEPMLLCLPEPEAVRALGDPFEVMSAYLRAMPAASAAGGCHAMAVVEESAEAFQFDVSWCVWLELARAAGAPEACIPNCHADQLVFPDYFSALGMRYRRTQTLACGGTCCDFRFERGTSGSVEEPG